MSKRILALLRSFLAIALAAFVLLGPAYRQMLGGKEGVIPRWVMFSGKALGIYGVHFELVQQSGETRTVTWGEFDPPRKERDRVQAARAHSLNDIAVQAARICRRAGPDVQLFATVRLAVAEGSGWVPKGQPNLDLCLPKNRNAFARGAAPRDREKTRLRRAHR